MKKLLLVLAIGAFAACNGSATTTETTVDSSSEVTTIDTTMHSTTPDTLSTGVDTAAGAKVDSVHATPAH